MSTPRQSLTVKLTHAEIRIAELEALLAARPAAKSPRRIVAHTPWVRPAWMEAARAQAMATGNCIKATA